VECPSPDRFEAEVHGSGDRAASAEFWSHVESCPKCRERLLRHAEGRRAHARLLRHARPDRSPRAECPSAEELSDLVGGRLAADQAERVGRHVRSCRACSADAADLKSWLAEMSAMPAQAFQPRPRLSVLDRLALRVQRLDRRPMTLGLATAATAAVALILVAVGLMLVPAPAGSEMATSRPLYESAPKVLVGMGGLAFVICIGFALVMARQRAVEMPPAWLEAGNAEHSRVFVLDRRVVTIGRLKDNALVLPDADISRRHAMICWTGQHFVVVDLGSRNGTLLNGSPVESATIRDGDRVRIGAWTLRFHQGK